MKKLLALVLALVMVMGLATVGTSAAYSDSDDIDYSEAVDVMTAVGVFQGKGDAFAPKDGLNRAEAAKLVAYLMLGNKTAESMKGTGSRFTDVPASHWASGYIEYLASVGVVSGVGNNQFNPNGEVTAVQFAKMLLVALGYDAQLEGFVGSDWAINIQKLANDNDIYDDLDDVNTTDALNREQAAQMCLNDLQADMVKYADKGTTVKIGESTVVTGAKEAEVKKDNNANKYNRIGTETRDANGNYIIQLGEDLYNGDLKLNGTSDDLGRPANKWTYKNAEVGTYENRSDLLVATYDKLTKAALYDLIGKDAYENLTRASASQHDSLTIVSNGTTTYNNYADTTAIPSYFVKDSTAAATEKGQLFELYRVEGTTADRYIIVHHYTYLIQATADYNTSSEVLKFKFVDDTGAPLPAFSATKEIEGEDFPTVIGAKKDDYFVVTVANNDVQSVEKAVTVTGEVESYKTDDFVTISGTKYSYNKSIGGKLADDVTYKSNTTHGSRVEFSVGNEVKVITDSHGYILLVDDANYSSSYVYISEIGTTTMSTEKPKATAYFTDGTDKTITVKKLYYTGGSANGTTDAATMRTACTYGNGFWCTYTVDSDGYYTLKQADVSTAYTTGNADRANIGTRTDYNILLKDKANFIAVNGTTTGSALIGNGDTVLVVLDDGGDATVYNGVTNFPGLKVNTIAAADDIYIKYVVDGSTLKYVFVDADHTDSTSFDDGKASDDLTFIVKVGGETKLANDKSYTTVNMIRNGAEEKDVKVDSGYTTLTAGRLYYKVKTNSDDYINGATIATADNKILSGSGTYLTGADTGKIDYDGGTLKIGNDTYVLNTDTIVLVYGKNTANNDTAAIKTDANADYEWDVVSGGTLESNLDGFYYTYDFWAKLDDNRGTSYKINELYIWVKTATKIP